MGIKQLRKEKGLTQEKCAEYLQIPIRSYKRYEANEDMVSRIKYAYIINRLNEYGFIDEEHGKLAIDEIKSICADVFKDFKVDYCYLFGSYAKGYALPVSDINILLSSSLLDEEMKELERKLNEALHKNISLMSIEEAAGKVDLLKEVLKIGIRII